MCYNSFFHSNLHSNVTSQYRLYGCKDFAKLLHIVDTESQTFQLWVTFGIAKLFVARQSCVPDSSTFWIYICKSDIKAKQYHYSNVCMSLTIPVSSVSTLNVRISQYVLYIPHLSGHWDCFCNVIKYCRLEIIPHINNFTCLATN